MNFREFMDSIDRGVCPGGLPPCLEALWYDARGEWDSAHGIVQRLDDAMASRVHAYLHRKEGDDWNSRYWYRRAGTVYPQDLSLEQEWERLARALAE